METNIYFVQCRYTQQVGTCDQTENESTNVGVKATSRMTTP